jgi:hypothetical protein
MLTIRFAHCRRLEDERAPKRFGRWILVFPSRQMTVRLLSASPVESVGERHRVGYGNASFANTAGTGGKLSVHPHPSADDHLAVSLI